MPYVSKAAKHSVDGGAPQTVGELTYAITRELGSFLVAAPELTDGRIGYEHLAACLGALEGAKLDLIKRIIDPYEQRKRAENGDVWPDGILLEVLA